jgi:hypothetical protein
MMSNDLLALRGTKPHLAIIKIERISIMQHDFESKEWADNRQAFTDGVASLFASIIEGLDRLHALTFDAPWKNHRVDPACIDL